MIEEIVNKQKKEKKANLFCSSLSRVFQWSYYSTADRVPSLKIFKAKQGRMVNALALSGEEGRGKLR
jgi:hypothetical protein